MERYRFLDDYSEGCHPNILKALSKDNLDQKAAYGNDDSSVAAKQLIREKIQNENAGVYFVSGGTQANLIIASTMLRSHEAVISVKSGHILGHEAGAIEATGHKIIAVEGSRGKLTVSDVETALNEYSFVPHMVKPKMVYISNATEVGTIYIKSELEALKRFCDEKGLYLFMDGARLGTALCSEKNDVFLTDLGRLTDVFYIGGTKNGALMGECIVMNNPHFIKDLPIHIKQRGALLAKSRLIGTQFLELFKNDLYFELPTHANTLSKKLSEGIIKKGHRLASETETNQIFAILPNETIEHLKKFFDFYVWEKFDDQHSVIRLVTSWATDERQVERFIEIL